MSHKRAYQTVAEQIADLIDQGAYPPGTRLPGERKLAENLGVSRVTVREAEIALQAIGRLEIKSGSGVFVSEEPSANSAALPKVSVLELTEARLIVESEAAALAAHNITEDGLSMLAALLERIGVDDVSLAEDADRQFHTTIADATQNAAIAHSVGSLWRIREGNPEIREACDAVCAQDPELRIAEHREIFDALKTRDPATARRAMRKHFQRLLEALLEATERAAMEDAQQKATQSRERYLATARNL